MLNVQPLRIEDGEKIYTVYVQAKTPLNLPKSEASSPSKEVDDSDEEDESYNWLQDAGKKVGETVKQVKLEDIQQTIQLYAKCAIGAFVDLAGAQVEELNLKFALKLSVDAGVPVLMEGSGEGNLEIEVKCKFPDKP